MYIIKSSTVFNSSVALLVCGCVADGVRIGQGIYGLRLNVQYVHE